MINAIFAIGIISVSTGYALILGLRRYNEFKKLEKTEDARLLMSLANEKDLKLDIEKFL